MLSRLLQRLETRTLGFLVVAAMLLGAAAVAKPLLVGDALEYVLQTESLSRHGSPEVRAGDVYSLAREDLRLGSGLGYALGYRGYFDDPAGHWYACHFWAYSLLAVPARLVLGSLGLNGLRAFPLMNAALFLLALHRVLFALPIAPPRRLALFLLIVSSPVVWFVRWPHAEVITVASVTLALVARHRGRAVAAVLWAALASLQCPPFLLLVGVLWAEAAWRDRRVPALAKLTLAAATSLLSPLFYWWRFGTPSLLAREAASATNLSPWRALELFLDLNIGLVRAMPVTVLLFAVASIAALARIRRTPGDAVLPLAVALMAFTTTATDNWNHGTIGPSRYAVWLLPCVLFVVATATRPLSERGWRAAMAAAIVTQAAVTIAHGGPVAKPDYLEHSLPARLALRYLPALYNPSDAVFVARTTHDSSPQRRLVVYLENGRCRKALACRAEASDLLARCGSIPEGSRAFFAGPPDANARAYVNYE
jgi:hypothetical protein